MIVLSLPIFTLETGNAWRCAYTLTVKLCAATILSMTKKKMQDKIGFQTNDSIGVENLVVD